MALCPKCSWPLSGLEGEMPKCIKPGCGYDSLLQRVGSQEAEIRTGPDSIDSVEIRKNGNAIAHCDKDDVWWVHMAGEEFKLSMIIEMMVLLEETLHQVSETMKGMASDG